VLVYSSSDQASISEVPSAVLAGATLDSSGRTANRRSTITIAEGKRNEPNTVTTSIRRSVLGSSELRDVFVTVNF